MPVVPARSVAPGEAAWPSPRRSCLAPSVPATAGAPPPRIQIVLARDGVHGGGRSFALPGRRPPRGTTRCARPDCARAAFDFLRRRRRTRPGDGRAPAGPGAPPRPSTSSSQPETGRSAAFPRSPPPRRPDRPGNPTGQAPPPDPGPCRAAARANGQTAGSFSVQTDLVAGGQAAPPGDGPRRPSPHHKAAPAPRRAARVRRP